MRSEDRIQRAIVEYLEAVVPRALVWAIPNAAPRTWSGRAANAVAGLRKGMPDLGMLMWDGEILWIEVKTPSGKLSVDQLNCHDLLRQRKATVVVVSSVDEMRRELAYFGIETREAVT